MYMDSVVKCQLAITLIPYNYVNAFWKTDQNVSH